MKLTAKIKLNPTSEQRALLLETLTVANQACNQISKHAWGYQVFSKYRLQKIMYYAIREEYNLTAQVVIRCLGKVADAYKKDKRTKRIFKKLGSIPYDNRILKYLINDQAVSIWTVAGRVKIPFLAGEPQLRMLQTQQGESDLVYKRGKFYLYATCDVEEATPYVVDDIMGVDLGIANIAVDSYGTFHTGNHVKSVRYRHKRLRKKLQAKGTKSAKRRLKQLSGKEKRFANDVNHCVSKAIVHQTQRNRSAIALEDLKGIRERVRASRQHPGQLHSWAFYDLQQKIAYKAQREGVTVVFVDPKHTSQMCSACGYVAKSNRKSQDRFLCTSCGTLRHADYNAAMNIRDRGRGAVNHPYVSA